MRQAVSQPPITAESFVRDILASEEYREALKGRLLGGTAKVAELELAARLGLTVQRDEAADAAARAAMEKMPRFMRRIMARLIRISNGSVPVPACREIIGAGGGLLFETEAETGPSARYAAPIPQDMPTEPDVRTSDLTDDGLLPPKRTP